MREVGIPGNLLAMIRLHNLNRRKVMTRALAGVIILCSYLVVLKFLGVFVRPADAMDIGMVATINNFYSDDTAYYCAHYGPQGSSVATICQAPEMAVGSVMATMRLPTGTVYTRDCRTYDSIFRRYDWNIAVAEAICQAESDGNPYAVSMTNDYGLMQLHNMAIFDPAQNIAAAYRKYLLQGWGAWTTYNTERYLAFL